MRHAELEALEDCFPALWNALHRPGSCGCNECERIRELAYEELSALVTPKPSLVTAKQKEGQVTCDA